MTDELAELLQSLTTPMSPITCGVKPKLQELEGVRAVLFDVYGTLLISAGGDIGLSTGMHHAQAMAEALEAMGIELTGQPNACLEMLRETVGSHQAGARELGIEHPEVDITAVWRDALDGMKENGLVSGDVGYIDPQRIAVEYEWRANPVAPMPNAEDCLETLRLNRTALGIVSNAQFFTPLSIEALFGADLATLGFSADLLLYSYEKRVAKPDVRLFELAANGLRSMDMEPNDALFVGNDAHKDVAPAAKAGFRTALFAGDKRSLRPQPLDSLEPDIVPDLIVTDLAQIPRCVWTTRM